MERLLIILAVLVCVVAGVAAVGMAARGQRAPLRMGHDLDEDDEHLLLGSVGPSESPIDRSAQVLDAQILDARTLEAEAVAARLPDRAPVEPAVPIEPPRSDRPEGAR